MRRSSPIALVLASALVGSVGTGCGASRTVDAATAQDYIRANLVKQGVAKPSVSCPSDVAVHPGRTFDCTAMSGGQRVSFTLRELDASGKSFVVVSFRQE